MKGRLLFLGTGGSLGVPMVGCECSVCHSTSPLNQRLRPSVLVKIDNKQFLIDAGPDLRLQALRYHIQSLDGVLLTHAHHDHTAGIDELRAFYYKSKKPLPVLLSAETAKDIQMRYYYIFQSGHAYDKFTPRIDLHILPYSEGEINFEGCLIRYLSYEQGGMVVKGFRFGNLAYLSDIRTFSLDIFQQLKGVKTLIISALRYETSPLHFSVDEAVDFAAKTEANKVWITHISHALDHDQTNAYLPIHIRMAYDGLEIDFW